MSAALGELCPALPTHACVQPYCSIAAAALAGTAGGFRSRGAAIADVFVSTGMVNHDRRIPIPVRPACSAGGG